MYAWLDNPLSIESLSHTIAQDTAHFAHRAMLIEVYTTPKPGLVRNNFV